MSFALWAAFAVAATGLILIPGPTTLLIIGYAVSSGVRAALAGMLGVVLGDLTAMGISMAGLGAILAASAELFTAMKWLGAAYLVYLGIKLWRTPATAIQVDGVPAPLHGMTAKAFTVTVLNPKGILFFSALMPQFIDAATPALPQMGLLAATFCGISVAVMTCYVLMSGRLRRIVRNASAMRLFNRFGGTVLIGAGLMTASLKRAT